MELRQRDYVAIQQKISNWLEMRCNGHSFNKQLYSLKEFHSPAIEKKLLEYSGLDEKGSNMDPRDFDPTYIPKDADYEKLGKEQREAWEFENNINNKQQQTIQEKRKTITLERFYGATSNANKEFNK